VIPASGHHAQFLTGYVQKNMAHIMVDYEMRADEPLPPDYLEPIKRLWEDEGVKRAIAKGNEFALHDNLD
jgi:guanine nucleotide-binding protein subunit alpha, other